VELGTVDFAQDSMKLFEKAQFCANVHIVKIMEVHWDIAS